MRRSHGKGFHTCEQKFRDKGNWENWDKWGGGGKGLWWLYCGYGGGEVVVGIGVDPGVAERKRPLPLDF